MDSYVHSGKISIKFTNICSKKRCHKEESLDNLLLNNPKNQLG